MGAPNNTTYCYKFTSTIECFGNDDIWHQKINDFFFNQSCAWLTPTYIYSSSQCLTFEGNNLIEWLMNTHSYYNKTLSIA